jgi:hypothetical protein
MTGFEPALFQLGILLCFESLFPSIRDLTVRLPIPPPDCFNLIVQRYKKYLIPPNYFLLFMYSLLLQ